MQAVYHLGLLPREAAALDGEELDLMLAGYRWRWDQNATLLASAIAALGQIILSIVSRDAAEKLTADAVEEALAKYGLPDPFAPARDPALED